MARRTKKPRSGSTPVKKVRALRRLNDDFVERRFEGEAETSQYVWVVALNLGAICLGAGVWGQFFAEAPIGYSHYVLAAGVVFVCVYLLFGSSEGSTLYVGDLGVGFGREDKVERTRWYEINSVMLAPGLLKLVTDGKPLTVSIKQHGAAARRIVNEALKRLPDRVQLDDEDVHRIGRPKVGEGERVDVDPPQVTNERCSATDKPLTFEKDVRMCNRCGALYHSAGVPSRCKQCGKKLKK